MFLFLKKTLLFVVIAITIFLAILSLADGYTDPFYVRFTTPKQKNLILGTSKAAQGLIPSIFDSVNKVKIYNYAFTLAHSPYGSIYLNSIKKKLDSRTKNGIFILTVDPWSVSSKLENPNDSASFREIDMVLDNTRYVDLNPNYFYLLSNLKGEYYSALKMTGSSFLHQDGWLEISIDMDSKSHEQRIAKKMKEYREKNLNKFKFSSLRFRYLKKTINFLSKHGEVYLVRLPVHPQMIKMENELMPEFDNKIATVTPLTQGYLNLTNNNEEFIYTDGVHLYKESARLVSKQVAEWIKTSD